MRLHTGIANKYLHRILGALALAIFAGACSPAAEPVKEEPRKLPPGFTDEPPPAPTSDTIVLSGGTLLIEPPVEDSVVVITSGQVTAWGRRGEVDLPNDSIGMDLRGKWLKPATALAQGTEADLELYSQLPQDSALAPSGYVKGLEISLPENPD